MTKTIKNREVYAQDPGTLQLLNNGVAEVAEVDSDALRRTLRFELQTFVCEGEYEKGLEKILEMAVESGDVMDFQQVLKALGREATDEEWNRIGQRAMALKKYTFALQAFEKSRNEQEMARLKEKISTEGTSRDS